MPAGRPSKFNEQVKKKILDLAEKGYTDKQIAKVIGVHENTLGNWKLKDQEFLWSLKEAKVDADALVEASLFQRAVGYVGKETKVFCEKGEITEHTVEKQFAPDTTAAIFWLKNRKPDEWRDKREVEVDQSQPFKFAYDKEE